MNAKKKAGNKKADKPERPLSEKQEETIDLPPPKRPKTSYIAYLMDKRGEFLKKNPELKGRDVLRQLGKQWSQLSDAEKQPYIAIHQQDKQRYERQLREYKETGRYSNSQGELDRPHGAGKRRSSLPQAKPKRKGTSKSKK